MATAIHDAKDISVSANPTDDDTVHEQPDSSSSTSPQKLDVKVHEHDHEVVECPHRDSGLAMSGQNRNLSLLQSMRQGHQRWLAYIKTRNFWLVLILGQVLSLCLTGTNTFSNLLFNAQASLPAFQTLLNYILLNFVYTSYTIYRYGLKGWANMVFKRGWKYFILAFLDACGNYFFVLAYRYTSILSAQLINFWAIVVVVVISFTILRVRYRVAQYAGILICVGGMGILLASDHIKGSRIGEASDQLKGDLFCLAGATFYGFSNVLEEFLVSKEPMYEVIGQLAFWATPIMGVIAAIFDREAFKTAQWTPTVGGYLIGYALILSIFYTLAPLMFRLASAAFFNISLLTANFWGVIIGIQVLHETIHWMYPIAFVLIIIGLLVYFLSESMLGEAHKPWLGENQEQGISGVGTAKWTAKRRAAAAAVATSSEPSSERQQPGK